MTVEYRTIEGFPNYRVGSEGSVWSKVRACGQGNGFVQDGWRLLKPVKYKRGYLHVTLSQRTRRKVHHLVLEAFVGKCPHGMEGCHFPDRDTTL